MGLLGLILLLMFISGKVFSIVTPEYMISGQIFGADGKAPILSHVHLTVINETYRNQVQLVKANPDGQFVMKIKNAGLYNLWIGAVNHESLRIPMVVTKNDQKITLKINLKQLPLKNTLDEIRILGDWYNFDNRKMEIMQRNDDGSYLYKGNANSNAVTYQLMGVVDDQLVPGTMADAYDYDNNLGYRSILKVKPGPFEIIFKPSSLPRIVGKDLPKVSFDKTHVQLEQIFNLTKQYEQKAAESKNGLASTSDLDELNIALEKDIHNGKNLLIRQFSAVYLIELLSLNRKPVHSDLGLDIINIMPANSAFWGIEPNTAVIVGYSLLNEFPDLLKQFSELNPDPKVRAKALIAIANQAKSSGDAQKVNQIYTELVKDYGSIKEIQYELSMLNPNRRIDKDKPVPVFSVKLLGSGETVSNQSLLGKYYLLDFWATWCGRCRKEMSFLHDAYEKYHEKGFEILSLSLDDKPADVDKFRNGQWKMPWLHSFVEEGFDSQLMRDFEAKGLPKMIFIGPDGKIIASDWDLQAQNLEKTISKYLENP